jgi:hypothetical protein
MNDPVNMAPAPPPPPAPYPALSPDAPPPPPATTRYCITAAVTVKLTVVVIAKLVASLTPNTTLAAAYGRITVPETTPVLEFKVNPVGNVPEAM